MWSEQREREGGGGGGGGVRKREWGERTAVAYPTTQVSGFIRSIEASRKRHDKTLYYGH